VTYPEALDWLFAQTRAGLPRDPQRMRRLIHKLKLAMPPKTIHVVGTNGKGSTCQYLAAALTAAGYTTGRFLSPHVEDFRERIAVNQVLISEARVCQFVADMQARVQTHEAAFFELCFALALQYFDESKLDYAVIEAGVGAKNDATITLENTVAIVMTNIALDHQDSLGKTLEAITLDKAAAIRPGIPVITGITGEARALLQTIAKENNSPFYAFDAAETLFSLPKPFSSDPNMALSAAALRLLGIPEAAIQAGLTTTPLPARREVLVIDGRTVILDGAHNPAAAARLLESLDKPFVLLFGALPKKQGEATLQILEPHAKQVFITDVQGQLTKLSANQRIYISNSVEAFEEALEACGQNECLVITGSFYLAGQLRPHLRARSLSTGYSQKTGEGSVKFGGNGDARG
jgi:dihydrofolate synthase / folylpolyglutamate synthase